MEVEEPAAVDAAAAEEPVQQSEPPKRTPPPPIDWEEVGRAMAQMFATPERPNLAAGPRTPRTPVGRRGTRASGTATVAGLGRATKKKGGRI